MPLPTASFTHRKWLGFFAELTAKLTHHNVLVVIEGCEMLKRVLMTRISILAVLQEGHLLAHFVNTIIGGLQRDCARGDVLELNEELTYTQLDTLSFCVDLMVSVHADGDAYDRLLVLARAGPIVEALLEALQRLPKPFFGLIGRLLNALLRLPLGHPVPNALSEAVIAEGAYTVSIQKHLDELRQLCVHQGPLLQDAVDVLTLLVATTQGPRRFCAMTLLNLAKKRLRKYRLRHNAPQTAAGIDDAGDDAGAEDDAAAAQTKAAATTKTARASEAVQSTSNAAASDGAVATVSVSQLTRDADFEVELDDHLALVNLSTVVDKAREGDTTDAEAVRPSHTVHSQTAATNTTRTTASATAAVPTTNPVGDDISGLVDREPSEVPFDLPAYLVDEVLADVANARSHAAFFAELDNLWCLATADVMVVSQQLTGSTLVAIERFLKVAPNTRQDRLVFVCLLQWTGYVLGGTPLKDASARAVLLGDVSVALWRVLAGDLSEREAKDAAQRHERANQHNLFMPSRRVAQQRQQEGAAEGSENNLGIGSMVLNGDPVPADLLPHAMARRTADELRLQPPSMAATILTFFLSVEHSCAIGELEGWLRASVTGGDGWAVTARYLQRAMGARSVLLDAPTTIDGTLSEELYLNWALKSALTDDITVATLSGKLVASLASRRGELLQRASEVRSSQPSMPAHSPHVGSAVPSSPLSGSEADALLPVTLHAAMLRLMPLLLHIGLHNPTLTSASVGEAASALYYCPPNPHATRYTTLGESALVALEVCVGLAASLSVEVNAHSPVTLQSFLLPSLSSLLRVTRDSLHPAVRAVPYRLLTHLCRTEDDVEALHATVPSLWRTSAASLLRCGSSASQWETAAAADWLVRLLKQHGRRLGDAYRAILASPNHGRGDGHNNVSETNAITAGRGTREEVTVLPSGVRLVREVPSLDAEAWSALTLMLAETVGPHLLDTLASSPLCYGATALVHLAVQIEAWQQRETTNAARAPSVPSVLLPRGARSLDNWASLAQRTVYANSRLARVSALLQATMKRTASSATATTMTHGCKGAALRALHALDTLASQCAYTAAVCEALRTVLSRTVEASSQSAARVSMQAKTAGECLAAFHRAHWIGALLSAVFAVPSPDLIRSLVAHRVGLPQLPLRSRDVWPLHGAYADMFGAASALGHDWLQGAVRPYMVALETPRGSGQASTSAALTLSALIPAPLLERVSALWIEVTEQVALPHNEATKRPESATQISPTLDVEATALHASWDAMCFSVGTLLTAFCDTCALTTQGTLLLAPLEPRAAALWQSATSPRRPHGGPPATAPSSSWEAMRKALQCALVQSLSGANEAARQNTDWLLSEAQQLEKDMANVQSLARRAAQAATAQGRRTVHGRLASEALPPFLQRLSLLTSVMSHTPSSSHASTQRSPRSQGEVSTDRAAQRSIQQCFCAALCEALFEPVTQIAALQAVRSLIRSETGRHCLVHEIASGEPIARTAFGRTLALTFELLPSLTCAPAAAAHTSPSRGYSPSRRGAQRAQPSPPTASPRVPLAVKDANRNTAAETSSATCPSHTNTSVHPRNAAPAAGGASTGGEEAAATTSAVALVRSGVSDDARVIWLGYEVCTLACRLASSLFVPWLLKCHIVERANDLVVLHELRWRQRGPRDGRHTRGSPPPASQVRAHYFFSTPHWARSFSEEVEREGNAHSSHAHAAARFTLLLRFLATISLDAEAQRWLFRQGPLLTILLERAGEQDSGEDGVLALLIVRNLCFHASLKTVLCQDLRVLMTLKAVAMGLPSVASLLLAPSDEQSTVAALAAAATSSTSKKRRNAALDDESALSVTDAKNKKAPLAGSLTPELRTFLSAARGSGSGAAATSMSSSALQDWALSVVARARYGSHTSVQTIADDDADRQSAKQATAVDAGRRLQRQSLAVAALWSLLFDHQRGKMYVKRALSQEPALQVDAIVDALPRPETAVQEDMLVAIHEGLGHVQYLCSGAI